MSAESLGRALLGRDVGMRTTASSWNIPQKYGPHGELFFFIEIVDFGRDAPLDAEEQEEHNVGNLSLEVVGQGWSSWLINLFLEDWELARIAVSCHLALDFCQEMHHVW